MTYELNPTPNHKLDQGFSSTDATGNTADFVTVMTAQGDRRMTKLWHRVDGTPRKEDYDKAKHFDCSERPVHNLDDLKDILDGLGISSCLTFGRLKDGVNPIGARRLSHDKFEGGEPVQATVEDAAHFWLPVDVDGIAAVDGEVKFDPIDDPERAVRCVLRKLPGELEDASVLWQWTSSAGMKPGIHMRLYFWLDRPLTGAEAAAWLKSSSGVDVSIYRTAQAIYAARPVFADDVHDPIKQRSGIRRLLGEVPVPAILPPVTERTPLPAREGVELDQPWNVDLAKQDLAHIHRTEGPWGQEDTPDTYIIAGKIKDLGISEELAVDLMMEYLPEDERGWLEQTVRNAYFYGQNDPGCSAYPDPAKLMEGLPPQNPTPASSSVATETDEDRRINDKFMTLGNSAAAPTEPTSLRNFVYSPHPATPMRELVPGWVEAGTTVMVSGRGGSHKSRLILQLCLSILYDRELFGCRAGDGGPPETYIGKGRRPRGGIDVGHIEFLSYEDDKNKIHSRVEKMKGGFKIADEPGGDDPSDRMAIWELKNSRTPLLMVNENGDVELTEFGRRMLRRWEKLAEDGRHTVLWFDSFFNAVQFTGNSKNIDICAQRVIGTLDHWCSVLNCTILAPFHPSRAGESRGDVGYSAAFHDTVREVLSITPKTRKVDGGGPHDREPNGEYQLSTLKWNEGPQGTKITFVYQGGALVSYDDQGKVGALTLMQGAVKVIEEFTYKKDVEALTRLRDPGLTDGERVEIERGFPNRVRDEGVAWKIGNGKGAITLARGHHVIARFREITGDDRAGESDFKGALEDARRAGLLEYFKSAQAARGDRRRPAGFCIGINPIDPHGMQ